MFTTVIGGTVQVAPDGVRRWKHGPDGQSLSGARGYGFAVELFLMEATLHAGNGAPLYFLDSGDRVLFGIDADGGWLRG